MNYLIVYNHTQSAFSPVDIHNTIITLDVVTDWWHYIPNVYIVSASKDEKYLADKILAAHPGLLFLVVTVDLNKYNGVLSRDAWQWMSKKNQVLLRVKPAPHPPKDPLRDYFLPKPKITPTSWSSLMKLMGKRAEDK